MTECAGKPLWLGALALHHVQMFPAAAAYWNAARPHGQNANWKVTSARTGWLNKMQRQRPHVQNIFRSGFTSPPAGRAGVDPEIPNMRPTDNFSAARMELLRLMDFVAWMRSEKKWHSERLCHQAQTSWKNGWISLPIHRMLPKWLQILGFGTNVPL